MAEANLHNRRPIIRYRLSAVGIHQEKIPAIRSKCAPDGVLNRQTGVDVRYYLTFAL